MSDQAWMRYRYFSSQKNIYFQNCFWIYATTTMKEFVKFKNDDIFLIVTQVFPENTWISLDNKLSTIIVSTLFWLYESRPVIYVRKMLLLNLLKQGRHYSYKYVFYRFFFIRFSRNQIQYFTKFQFNSPPNHVKSMFDCEVKNTTL